MWSGESMVLLCSCDVMEETDKLLTNQILLEQREIFYGAEDDRIGEDGGVKRMGGKGG